MMVLSNLSAQELQPGQTVTFDKVILKSGCGECWNRQIPNSVKLRSNGIWDLTFSGNVTSATAGTNVQLAISAGGYPLIETAMNRTIGTANALENISTKTGFSNCCSDTGIISVMNTGTVAVTLAPNSAFVVEGRGQEVIFYA